jgi:hypothetical protein
MQSTRTIQRRTCDIRRAFGVGVAFAFVIAGCAHNESEVLMVNPTMRPMTLAVAPVLNFSGEFTLDPVRAADLLASELSFVDGATVLPVSRVIAVLAAEGKMQIESPAHAISVAQAVGADAIIVAGITEYDAYTPVVGLALQVYSAPSASAPALDPVVAARQAEPFTVAAMADAMLPAGQVQIVYNATHAHVTDSVKKYAAVRSEGEYHQGWKQYVKVQTLFLRFCWHDAIERLLMQEQFRVAA